MLAGLAKQHEVTFAAALRVLLELGLRDPVVSERWVEAIRASA